MQELFISGFMLSLSLCLELGVVNIVAMKTGVERGFFSSFILGLGSCFRDLIYASLSMIGMSFIMQYITIRYFLWIGGTLILIYLAFTMIRNAVKIKITNGSSIQVENVTMKIQLLKGISSAF